MTTAVKVRAHDIQAEWARMPGAVPCSAVEPEPEVPSFPFHCSRTYDHLGPHAATVPPEDDDLGVGLIAAVWT